MTDLTPLQTEAEVVAQPQRGDDRLWSVTTILKAQGDSQALIEWSAGAVADTALDNLDWLDKKIVNEGRDEARSWLVQSRYRPAAGERSATKLGQAVHAAIEILVVTGRRPEMGAPLADVGEMDEEVVPYLDSFDLFLDHFQPTFTAAEMTVYNATYGYAGTLDGMATIGGQHVLIDYKTSKTSTDGRGARKKPWTDVGLQCAAYRHAEFAAVWKARRFEKYSRRYYLLNEEERQLAVPMPATDGAVVVHITPHHCDTYPLDVSEDTFTDFLYAIEAARISFEKSRNYIGQPLALLDRKAS